MKPSIRTGVNRVVVLLGPVAIKIPNPRYGVRYFVGGMLANILERQHWRLCAHPALIPSYLCGPLGLFLVQQRADVEIARRLTREEIDTLPLIGFDNNGHNAGFWRGRVTVFDYGNPTTYLVVGNGKKEGTNATS